jgi:hypothetical protein
MTNGLTFNIEENIMAWIVRAELKGDYKVFIEFNDGMSDTLCWDNGVDFAPEYLYEKIKGEKKKIA